MDGSYQSYRGQRQHLLESPHRLFHSCPIVMICRQTRVPVSE